MIPLIVACLVSVVTARPEAGYTYPSPSGIHIQNSGSSGFAFGSSGFTSGSNGFISGSNGFNLGSNGFTSGSNGFNLGSNGFTSGSSGFASGSSGFTSGSSGFTSGNNGFISGSNGFISGGNLASNFDYSTSSQVPLIHKHIYVHVAPPEPEVQQRQVISQSAAPQKHYKIVFIKAPSFPTPSTPVISAQAQNQEKTLIYVLVKRPEDAPQISIPTAAPTQPSKPEVYFIKYKTQKETSQLPNQGAPSLPTSAGEKGGPQSNASSRGSSQASYLPPSETYGPPGNSGPY